MDDDSGSGGGATGGMDDGGNATAQGSASERAVLDGPLPGHGAGPGSPGAAGGPARRPGGATPQVPTLLLGAPARRTPPTSPSGGSGAAQRGPGTPNTPPGGLKSSLKSGLPRTIRSTGRPADLEPLAHREPQAAAVLLQARPTSPDLMSPRQQQVRLSSGDGGGGGDAAPNAGASAPAPPPLSLLHRLLPPPMSAGLGSPSAPSPAGRAGAGQFAGAGLFPPSPSAAGAALSFARPSSRSSPNQRMRPSGLQPLHPLFGAAGSPSPSRGGGSAQGGSPGAMLLPVPGLSPRMSPGMPQTRRADAMGAGVGLGAGAGEQGTRKDSPAANTRAGNPARSAGRRAGSPSKPGSRGGMGGGAGMGGGGSRQGSPSKPGGSRPGSNQRGGSAAQRAAAAGSSSSKRNMPDPVAIMEVLSGGPGVIGEIRLSPELWCMDLWRLLEGGCPQQRAWTFGSAAVTLAPSAAAAAAAELLAGGGRARSAGPGGPPPGSEVGLTYTSPQPLALLNGVVFRHVSAGSHHAAAVAEDGQLYVWGSDSRGQLGRAWPSAQHIACHPLPHEVQLPVEASLDDMQSRLPASLLQGIAASALPKPPNALLAETGGAGGEYVPLPPASLFPMPEVHFASAAGDASGAAAREGVVSALGGAGGMEGSTLALAAAATASGP
ncbi:hypothetical protein TSOC_014513, partial [Tetrabaena socialis]